MQIDIYQESKSSQKLWFSAIHFFGVMVLVWFSTFLVKQRNKYNYQCQFNFHLFEKKVFKNRYQQLFTGSLKRKSATYFQIENKTHIKAKKKNAALAQPALHNVNNTGVHLNLRLKIINS